MSFQVNDLPAKVTVVEEENTVTIAAPGPQGAVGPGVAPGGTTGQVLAKDTDADYVTEWVTPKTVATDPVWDAAGDLVVGSGPDTASRLPVGTTNQVLMADPSQPLGVKWSSEVDPNAIQKTIVDAKGDLIVASAADTPDRLPVGTTNQVLVADPSAPLGVGWVDPTPKDAQYVTLSTDGTLTNERVLTAGTGISVTDAGAGSTVTVATSAILPTVVDAKGDLIVGSAADTVDRLPVGTTNQVLMADPAAPLGVKWSSEIDPTAISKSIIDAKGDLIVGSSSDTPDRLPVGATNQVLVADPTAPLGVGWVDPTPKNASYVTLGTDGTLTDERVLTAGSGITLTDGGAGSSVTVASFQPGGAARPLLTAGAYLDGSNGLVLSGLSGNYASTPDSAAVSVTGDIDIKAKVTMTDWTPAANSCPVGKWVTGGNQRSYLLRITTTGTLTLFTSANGASSLNATSTVATGFSDGATKWIRATIDVDDGAGNRNIKFYTSDDGTSWVQLGTTLTAAATTSIFDGTAALEVGAYAIGTLEPINGTVHRVIIQDAFDTADNTSNVVFDADFSAQTADALAFTEDSTNAATVTINTTRYLYGLPNVNVSGTATGSLNSGVDLFMHFFVTKAVTVDMAQFEVTTGPASNANVFVALYAADDNLQPTGAPIFDTGAVAVNTSQTGIFRRQITPVTLQPGIYLIGINSSVNMTLRRTLFANSSVPTSMGNSTVSAWLKVRANGAFPSSATWDGYGTGVAAMFSNVVLRWKAA